MLRGMRPCLHYIYDMKNGDYILVVAPANYPGKKYRDKYCYEHHLVYWQHYGIIPNENEVIHHKDGNKYNNNINNLELLTTNNHNKYHGAKHKRHMIKCLCPTCGNIFMKEYRQSHIFKKQIASYCSKECANKANKLRCNNDKLFLQRLKHNVINDNIYL